MSLDSPTPLRLNHQFLLRQLELLDDQRGDECSEVMNRHADYRIVVENDLLRAKLRAALEAILRHKEAQESRENVTWRWKALNRNKYDELGEEVIRLLHARTEKVREYELFRRLVAFDNKSIEIEL